MRVRSADKHHALNKAAGAEILGAPQSQPSRSQGLTFTRRSGAANWWRPKAMRRPEVGLRKSAAAVMSAAPQAAAPGKE